MASPPAHPLHPSTVAVTAGRPPHEPDQPLNAPITMASTYVAGGELEYGRYGNPTWTALEAAIGALEGGRCLAYSSGMAAVTSLLDLVALGDKVVVPRHSYNGTLVSLADLEQRGRVTTSVVDVTDTAAVRAACEDAALVWVDNTFLTPLLQRPLELGADVSLHSATKYLAGHSDVQLGAVVTTDDELYAVLKGRRDVQGNIPGPFEAWLALRGLRTLHLRVERAQANAAELARRLSGHPVLAEVRYPGMGSMISIVLPTADHADLLVRATSLWVNATSLGGVESTLERRRRWKSEPTSVPEGLVRLSVGIEGVEDLWADLSQALDRVQPIER